MEVQNKAMAMTSGPNNAGVFNKAQTAQSSNVYAGGQTSEEDNMYNIQRKQGAETAKPGKRSRKKPLKSPPKKGGTGIGL